MKKFLFSLMAIVLVSLSGNAQKFVDMKISDFMKSREDIKKSETIVKEFSYKNLRTGEKGQAKIKVIIPDNGEGVLGIAFTDNFLNAGGIGDDFFVLNEGVT